MCEATAADLLSVSVADVPCGVSRTARQHGTADVVNVFTLPLPGRRLPGSAQIHVFQFSAGRLHRFGAGSGTSWHCQRRPDNDRNDNSPDGHLRHNFALAKNHQGLYLSRRLTPLPILKIYKSVLKISTDAPALPIRRVTFSPAIRFAHKLPKK